MVWYHHGLDGFDEFDAYGTSQFLLGQITSSARTYHLWTLPLVCAEETTRGKVNKLTNQQKDQKIKRPKKKRDQEGRSLWRPRSMLTNQIHGHDTVRILSVFCSEPWHSGGFLGPGLLGFLASLASGLVHTQLMHVMHHSARPVPVILPSSYSSFRRTIWYVEMIRKCVIQSAQGCLIGNPSFPPNAPSAVDCRSLSWNHHVLSCTIMYYHVLSCTILHEICTTDLNYHTGHALFPASRCTRIAYRLTIGAPAS